ncbi:MAG: hypothetical protein JHD16_18645 [Solirubrobacteraceae bacterium]|nr:hypothetical protein [Solirubrobacteraceae bacterium]
MDPVKTTAHTAVVAKDRKGLTLYGIAAARVGKRRARDVLQFMVQWQIAMDALGAEDLTVAQYAEWWGESPTTAFRYQSWFREAFPGQQNPTYALSLARAVWDASKGVSGLSEARGVIS